LISATKLLICRPRAGWRGARRWTEGGSGEGQAVEVVGGAIEIVAIDDGCAVGDVGIVIVDYAMVVPVGSPVVPSPAEAAEEADAEAQAEGNAGSGDLQSWIGVPTRPGDDSIGQILTLEVLVLLHPAVCSTISVGYVAPARTWETKASG
jgi:hypothetical protein